MAINVLRYRTDGDPRWGVARDGRITPIPGEYATTADLLRDGRGAAREAATRADTPTIGEGEVEILSPITRNQQFVCQGVNYRDHMIEGGLDPDAKTFNMIFRKASSCIAPPSTDIIRPARVRLLDYEIELGIVLGREITGPVEVTARNLHEYVAGLVMTNDVSARDIQIPEMQFFKGKSFRTFGPTGPYLCLLDAEDFARIPSLRLELRVNGEVRQSAPAGEMLVGPAETLTELSEVMDLFPGDLLATGTPAGVALKAPPKPVVLIGNFLPERVKWKLFVKGQLRSPKYLKPGDEIRSTIRSEDGKIDLGTQRNRVVAAGAKEAS